MAGAWSKMQKCQHLIKLDVEIDEKISTRKKSLKKKPQKGGVLLESGIQRC